MDALTGFATKELKRQLKDVDPDGYKKYLNLLRVKRFQKKKRDEVGDDAFKAEHRLVEAKSKIVRELKKKISSDHAAG